MTAGRLTERVLVVDDDPIVLEFMTLLLEQQGYLPVPCSNPLDALEKLGKEQFDVVLTDIVMPVLSGIDLIEKVHAVDADLPVILITGNADLEKAVLAIKRKAFDFILKPSKPEQIIHTIERALKFRRLIEIEKDYMRVLEDFNQEVETLVADRTKSVMGLAAVGRLRGAAEDVVRTCTGLLRRGGLPEEANQGLTLLAEKAKEIRRGIRESRIFRPTGGPGRQPEDLNSIVGEILSLMAEDAARKDLEFSVQLSDNPLMVRTEKSLLKAALAHLVRNAVKVTSEGGTVMFSSWDDGRRVFLSISDTGPGFPKTTLRKIFDPTYFPQRLESGMSLPLIREIILEHKGTIRAESKVGQGTRFVISFPAHQTEGPAEAEHDPTFENLA